MFKRVVKYIDEDGNYKVVPIQKESTGVFDILGKEIWEWDKVKFEDHYDGDYLQKGGIGEVKYEDGSWGVVECSTGEWKLEVNSSEVSNYGVKVVESSPKMDSIRISLSTCKHLNWRGKIGQYKCDDCGKILQKG